MSLRNWQETLQDHILRRGAADLSLRPAALPPTRQLAIYQNAYGLRLEEALRSNFPALHQLLGDTDFARAAQQFMAAHPPTTASIRWFGAHLPDWLASTAGFNACPLLAELAQFEWALRHCVDSANARRLHAAALQQLPPEHWGELCFALHPSVTRLTLTWNTPPVWQALTDGTEPPPPQRHPQPGHWLVYRQADRLGVWRSMDALEAATLEGLARGQCFADLCEFLYTQLGDADRAVAQAALFLKVWVEQGLLCAPTSHNRLHNRSHSNPHNHCHNTPYQNLYQHTPEN